MFRGRFVSVSSRILRFTASRKSIIPMSFIRVGETGGDRIPLVIGHGLFGQKQNWNSVSKALNRKLGVPIYLIDWRNHGESPWTDTHTYELMSEDMEAFIKNVVFEETDTSKVNIIGHSMGGKAISHFAVQESKQTLINKVIVEDVAPTRGSSPSLFHGYVEALQKLDLNKPRREILIDLEQVVPSLKVRQFLLTNLVVDPSDSGRFKWKINLAGIGKSMSHILVFKLDEGQKFDGPALFVYGEHSNFLVESDKPDIERCFPKVVFRKLPTGHWIHAEAPELFVDTIVEFLDN